jgi:predicted dehydrogenase
MRRAASSGGGPTVKFGVVGLGHIAQAAILPAFAHASNAELAVLVSGDPVKLKKLSRKYRVAHTAAYEEYDACLAAVDAVYIALPNSMHAEYAIRAARAGVHVLCEKPLAVTSDECARIVDACDAAGVKLMTAYRLHFEPINLAVAELVRSGRLGEPKYFSSTFSMRVREGDIRTRRELGGGTLYDIGVYCINAARDVFRSEPVEVATFSVNTAKNVLPDVDETSAALLRFEGERLAAFVTSFNAADVSSYRVVGTRGDVHVEPAFEYAEPLGYTLTVNGRTKRVKGRKTDQFAPQIVYFADCILRDRQPEPSGREGWQDVRIIEALYESSRRGTPVRLAPFQDERYPGAGQRITRPAVQKVELIRARSASLDPGEPRRRAAVSRRS